MIRVPVTIQRRRFLIPLWAVAQVPAKRTIWVKAGYRLTQAVLAHELVHVVQAERVPNWPLAYFAQWVASGFSYRNMPYEVEARRLQNDPWYRSWASDIMDEGGYR